MSEKINNLEVSMGQLKDSREKGMLDVVREKERLQEEVTKAMHKVRVSTNMITKIIRSNAILTVTLKRYHKFRWNLPIWTVFGGKFKSGKISLV